MLQRIAASSSTASLGFRYTSSTISRYRHTPVAILRQNVTRNQLRWNTIAAVSTESTTSPSRTDYAALLKDTPETGFIDVGPGEGLLYFDNVYPLVSAFFDARYLIMRLDHMSIAQRLVQYSLPKDFPIEIKSITPRIKDGGAFLKFVQPPGVTTEEVEQRIQDYLNKKAIRPWFNPLRQAHAYRVEGKPWLEDLYRFPSTGLKVEFDGPDVPAETLYAAFRKFGRMVDILPQPKDSKELPRYSTIRFRKIRSATAAKNCMHDFVIVEDGVKTNLRILFAESVRTHAIRDWFMNHPKIVLPALAALVATLAVSIFDPIRTWFVKQHITHSLDITSKAWKWVKAQTSSYLDLHRSRHANESAGDISALLEERKSSVEQLQGWLLESAETFIVVQGPRGSGKRELVFDEVLKDWKYKLSIDCESIQEAHGDSQVIQAVAQQVGYKPVFSWLNTINSFLDLAAQGTLGTGAGLSETLETQFAKILANTAKALKEVALGGRTNVDKDSSLNDDEYLEAHPEKRAVVVIDNFLHRIDDSGDKIYQRLADWAGLLVSANVAHVIFLTNDISFSKQLSKSLPDRVFRQVLLGDASPEAAKRYVVSHISSGKTQEEAFQESEELNTSIQELGGRLTDLEFLARRIRAGERPKQAVTEIVKTSAMEILKLYFLGDSTKRKWSTEQAWVLLQKLSKEDEVRYNEILLHTLFSKGGEETIQALEQADMISLIAHDGRPAAIKPGKPVYRAAFRKLQEDAGLKAKMELDIATLLQKAESANVAKYEEELNLLGSLPSQPVEISARVAYLLRKLQKSQAAVEAYDAEMAGLKKILQVEF